MTRTRRAMLAMIGMAAITLASTALDGCKKKVTQAQCDEVLDHFAELVVKERFVDAGPDAVATERERERKEAKGSDEFKNCTTEVQESERVCAMKAQSSDGLIKCLE